MRPIVSRVGRISFWILFSIATLYFFGAVYIDGPMRAGSLGNLLLALLWLGLIVYLLRSSFESKKKYGCIALAFAVVLIPRFWITASNERDWQPEFQNSGMVDIEDDTLTFHRYRNFIHSAEGSVARWETRSFHLSKLKGIDLFFDAFGGEVLAHTILSFDFGDEGRLCLSIEARREVGEEFSPLGGLYKMFELQYIFGSEEDMVALRTEIRDEPVFLYRFKYTSDQSRFYLTHLLRKANEVHENPEFYNVIFKNCTTSLRTQIPEPQRMDFDWRILLNGYLDSYLFEQDMLVTDGLSFDDYNQQAKINKAAGEVKQRSQFSQAIREGRVGF